MEIIELQIDKLKPYSKNAKMHPEEQVEHIANSIKEFGWKTPIVVDEDFSIIQGHGRHKAALSMGLKTAPCIIADELSKEQVKMLRLADNKVAESEWDIETLDMELEDMTEFFRVEDFGFEFELEEERDLGEEDAVPELEENPVIKLGDLIEMGEHRLLCGDSTSEADVEKLMDGKKADMVFTDPDYSMDDDSWTEHMLNVGIKRGVPVFIMASDKQHARYVSIIPNFRKFFAGVRNQALMISQYVPMNKLTLVSYFGEEPSKYFNNLRDHFTDVFDFERHAKNNEEEEGHRHYKNVEIPTLFISHYSKRKNIILDLFGGSGTTLIASSMLGRKSFTMEIEGGNVQLIIDRYSKYSSIEEVVINGKIERWETYKKRDKK